MPSDVTTMLVDISRQLGELTAEVRATNVSLAQHLQDDAAIRDRVTSLETNQNRVKWTVAGASAVFVAVAKAVEFYFTGVHR